MKNCLFCRIAAREVPSKIVYEDEELIAFKDINPVAPVHILIIPKKHISGITSMKEEDKEIVGKIHLAFAKIAREFSIYQCGFRIVVNSGPDASQTVDHLHFHLLGGRTLSWPPG